MVRVLIVLLALVCATSSSLAQVVVCQCAMPVAPAPEDDCCCADAEPADGPAIAGLGCCRTHLRSGSALPPAVTESADSPEPMRLPASTPAPAAARVLRPRSRPAPTATPPPPLSGAERRIRTCSFLT